MSSRPRHLATGTDRPRGPGSPWSQPRSCLCETVEEVEDGLGGVVGGVTDGAGRVVGGLLP